MLTKKDLTAIKALFSDEFKGINKRFDSMDKEFDSVDKRFNTIDKQISHLSMRLDANTKDLTDLILAGFSTHEPMLENHERRITRLEKSTFPSN